MGLFKKTPKIVNKNILRLTKKCYEWKVDTLFITTRNSCSYCKQFNRKIYSLYGWNKKYPKIPDVLLSEKCPECQGIIGASMYFSGISSSIKK